MAENYFRVLPSPYENDSLESTATLAFTASDESRMGVIITNLDTTTTNAPILVSLSNNFSSAPANHAAFPTLIVPPNTSVQTPAGKGVAIWVSHADDAGYLTITQVQG